MQDNIWSQRTALVTGASSGIGLAAARKILERGGRVIALARDEGELAQAFGDANERLYKLPFDLSRVEKIESALQTIPSPFSSIDCLVNCAGHDVGGRVRYDTARGDDVVSVIGVNLIAMMLITRTVLPKMIESGKGDILNVGSISSREPGNTIVAYTTSKFGVHGFTLSLRNDLAKTPLRVMEVIPGPVRTNFATTRWHGDKGKGDAYYDNRGPCLTPDQVGDAILWALDQPRGVTIAEIVVQPTGQH